MNVLTFVFGLLFGLGLLLSGMADPGKVLAFLDIAGAWDPSLAFVMLGAIGVALIPFQFARRPRAAGGGRQPARSVAPPRPIDRPLLLGSAIFGVGWGLAGFCPGPAVVGLVGGYLPAAAFFIAMMYGFEIHLWFEESRAPERSRPEAA